MFQRSLSRSGDPSKALDIQLLMERAFSFSHTRFWIEKNNEIRDKVSLARFNRLLNRLMKNEPVHYILGEKEFYGYPFYVNKNALIPRPETEILVEQALMELKEMSAKLDEIRVLDIGAGSGVIAITLALQAGVQVMATDISPKALFLTKKNACRHRVGHLIHGVQADIFPPGGHPPPPGIPKRFRLIVSNPPYIPEGEWRELAPQVRDFEPKTALASGEDGLELIARIISQAPEYLDDRGVLLLEIGYNQKERVTALLMKRGYDSIRVLDDYSGVPRIARAGWREN